MRVTENVEQVVVIQELKGIQCNKCGKSFQPSYANSIQQIDLSFGYSSEFDGQRWSLDLCEHCLLDIIKGCKVVPEGFMIDPSYLSPSDGDHDLHQQNFEDWKISGEWKDDAINPYEGYVHEPATTMPLKPLEYV